MDLRKLSRGKECLLRLPGVCNHNSETTVLAHVRRGGVAGAGQKPPDLCGVWACSDCHDVMDGRVPLPKWIGGDLDTYILEGLNRTLAHVSGCADVFKKASKRTIEQNRLQRLWINEIHEQRDGDQTKEEIRAYCKLHFGVPILRNDDEQFREAYDRVIRPLDYSDKIFAMSVPLDFPVTRLMTTKQKTRYLEEMRKYFLELGVRLTDPDER